MPRMTPLAERERPHAQRTAPIVGHHLPIHARMLLRHVLEHRLVHVHLAHRKRDAKAAQGHEHERYEESRQRDGHEVQRKVDERRDGRAHESRKLPSADGSDAK